MLDRALPSLRSDNYLYILQFNYLTHDECIWCMGWVENLIYPGIGWIMATQTYQVLIPGTWQSQDLDMGRLFWIIWVVSKSNSRCPYKRETGRLNTEKRNNIKMEQGLEWCSHKPGEAYRGSWSCPHLSFNSETDFWLLPSKSVRE